MPTQEADQDPRSTKPIVRRIILSLVFGLAITALPLFLSFMQVEILLTSAFLWGPGIVIQSTLGGGEFQTHSVAIPMLLNIAFYGTLMFLFLMRKQA